MIEEIIQSWRINQSMNHLLLEAIDESWLPLRAAPRGRTVGEQWAHMSNVKIKWMEIKAKGLLEGLSSFPKEYAHNKNLLLEHLENSSKNFEPLFEQYKNGIKAKGNKQSITSFFSYLMAHDAHHRGQILLHLKLCGHVLPDEVRYGIWNWE